MFKSSSDHSFVKLCLFCFVLYFFFFFFFFLLLLLLLLFFFFFFFFCFFFCNSNVTAYLLKQRFNYLDLSERKGVFEKMRSA